MGGTAKRLSAAYDWTIANSILGYTLLLALERDFFMKLTRTALHPSLDRRKDFDYSGNAVGN